MKTLINARIDVSLKKELQKMADAMGLPLSSLISATLTKLARDKRIELSAGDELTESAFWESFEEVDPSTLDPRVVAEIKTSRNKDISEFSRI